MRSIVAWGVLGAMLLSTTALAVRVEESRLTEDSIVVILSEYEVRVLQEDRGNDAYRVAEKVAYELIELAGIPESITGKVAALTAWVPMVEKYKRDLDKAARHTPTGHPLTLKYTGVNLEGVRRLWAASAAGDYIMPGGEMAREVAGAANDILNVYLRAREQQSSQFRR